MKKKIIDNWEICKPYDKGLYAFDGLSYLDDEHKDDSSLIYQEQKLILGGSHIGKIEKEEKQTILKLPQKNLKMLKTDGKSPSN